MLSGEKLVRIRILHVTVMFATALFIYQFCQWEDALWIPITVVAIMGPFRPGYSIDKARQRILGSIAGLLLSLILSVFLHYNYDLLPLVAVVLIYLTAFTVLLEYKYFIMMVTIMLCINFNYMNLSINSELTYLVNRAACVFTGIFICQAYEYFIFKRSYANATSLVDSVELERIIEESTGRFSGLQKNREVSLESLDECIAPLIVKLDELSELKDSSLKGYSDQSETIKLVDYYNERLNSVILSLSRKAFRALDASGNVRRSY